MDDKREAFEFIKVCFGKYPPSWVTLNDYGLTRWEDIGLYSGTEIRYKTQKLHWIDQGYPLKHRCREMGHNDTFATDIYYRSEKVHIPAVFYCKWCNALWASKDAPAGRLEEIRSKLGLK